MRRRWALRFPSGWALPGTKRCYAILLLLAVNLFFALATGLVMYYRLLYVLGFAFVASWLWGYLNIRGVRVEVEPGGNRLQVGDTVNDRLMVHNASSRSKAWLEVQQLTTMPGGGAGQVIGLEARGQRTWRNPISMLQRGVFTLGPVQVTSGDAFGLFQHRRVFPQSREVVVYPATEDLPYLTLTRAGSPEDGPRRRPVHQPTPQAAGVREHQPTDTISRIHWPTTLRMRKLYVKQFEQGTGQDLWLILDLHRQVHAGAGPESTEEYAVTVAASVASKYLGLRVPVGLIAHGQELLYVPADQSTGQLARLLELLARVRADGQTPLADVLLGGKSQFQRSSTVMVITPSMDPSWVAALTLMLQGGGRGVAVLVDPASFGGRGEMQGVREALVLSRITSYVVRRGEPLAESLSTAVALVPAAQSPREAEVLSAR